MNLWLLWFTVYRNKRRDYGCSLIIEVGGFGEIDDSSPPTGCIIPKFMLRMSPTLGIELITGKVLTEEVPFNTGTVPLKPISNRQFNYIPGIVCPEIGVTLGNWEGTEVCALSNTGGISVHNEPRCVLSIARFKKITPSIPSVIEV